VVPFVKSGLLDLPVTGHFDSLLVFLPPCVIGFLSIAF